MTYPEKEWVRRRRQTLEKACGGVVGARREKAGV